MATLGVQRGLSSMKTVGLTSRGFPSLFQPDSDDEYSTDSDSDRELQQPQLSLLPLNELIVEGPQNLSSVLDVLLPRLQPRAEIQGVSLQDQKDFMSVLVGELASQFSVIQHQIDDPFLNPQQNKALHKAVLVRVCQTIEELHHRCLIKAAGVRCEGVFSLAANLSRLRAELTLEANKCLNIPIIRRQVLTQIRGALPSINGDSPSGHVTRRRAKRLPPLPKQERKKKVVRRLSLDDLKLTDPLRTKMSRFGVRLESGAVRKRINKLHSRLPSDQYDEEDTLQWDESGGEPEMSSPQDIQEKHKSNDLQSKLCRVPSMPELWGGFLLCDLGLITRKNRPLDKSGEQHVLGIHRPPSVGNFIDLKFDETESKSEIEVKQLGDYTALDLSKDLHDLQASTNNKVTLQTDDLHPLLQAHGHGLSMKQAERLAQYDDQLRRAAEEKTGVNDLDTARGSLTESIPSVPTLEQLPYLTIEHLEGPLSSHPSMYVKSGLSLKHAHTRAAPSSTVGGNSQVISQSDLNASSFSEGSNAGLKLGDLDVEDHKLADSSFALPQDMEQFGGSSVFNKDEEIMSQSRGTSDFKLDGASGSIVEASMCGDSEEAQTEFERSGAFPSGFSVGSDFPSVHPEEVIESHISPPPTPHQAQPAVITTRFGDGGVVRTTDVRVSERTPLNELRLKVFGPVYNQITGELDSSMIEELDSTLHEGKEITGVYEEIMKTLSTGHLEFTHEPTLEPTIDLPIELSRILASDTLHHRRSRRVVNKSLYRSIAHPWSEEVSRKDWEKSNQYQGPDLDNYGIKQRGSGPPLSPRLAHISRAYTTWSNWWRATANSEDYLKYASREESDYLRLVYHLYDSDGSDSEAEEEARVKREKLEELQRKLKAKETRRQQRYSAKSRYESGAWNVNTVLMGGLGGDPECSSTDEDEPDQAAFSQQIDSPDTVQNRLQDIWKRLLFPESQQMDMAIKYSNPRITSQLNKVLNLWDEVCGMIEKREVLLSQLEVFEREASDPSRFFSKGVRGSSATRLSEARKRDGLHKDLDSLDRQVSSVVKRLMVEHGDIVTYKGRPYFYKMSSDRTEMLYWLQQERRQSVLKPAITTLTVDPAHHTQNIVSHRTTIQQ